MRRLVLLLICAAVVIGVDVSLPWHGWLRLTWHLLYLFVMARALRDFLGGR